MAVLYFYVMDLKNPKSEEFTLLTNYQVVINQNKKTNMTYVILTFHHIVKMIKKLGWRGNRKTHSCLRNPLIIRSGKETFLGEFPSTFNSSLNYDLMA